MFIQIQLQSRVAFFSMLLFIVAALVLPEFGFAQGPQTYQPLSPLPGTGGGVDATDSSAYLENMFYLGIGIAGVLAVIMLIIGGMQYITTSAFTTKEGAKRRIWAAVGGFILVLLSWLILYTINPDLLRLEFRSEDFPATQPPETLKTKDSDILVTSTTKPSCQIIDQCFNANGGWWYCATLGGTPRGPYGQLTNCNQALAGFSF